MAVTTGGNRSGMLLILAGAFCGLAIAIYYYVTPLTGVNGTFGAGLVIFSTAIMAVAALALRSLGRGWRNLVRVLILLNVICTAAAGCFLHEWWLIAAMAVALAGIILEFATPSFTSDKLAGARA